LRVVLVTLNPNQGTSAAHACANASFRQLLHLFRDGGQFTPVAEHTYRGLRTNWFGGHFKTLYLDGFGLDLCKIALANIAWCATAGDDYPVDDLLRPCFKQNTGRLLSALKPDVVLLAGKTDGRKFLKDVQNACPQAEVGVVLHCSYLGRVHDDEKKRQCISAAKAEFDEIIRRGQAKRAQREEVQSKRVS
jgi:hypothetical protein